MTRDNKHIKGDQAELIAQEFFVKKGFYVFKNISQHGPVDMAVMDPDGNILLLDIKALSLRSKNGWKVNRTPTDEQCRLGVQLLFVDLVTGKVMDDLPPKKKYKKNNVIQLRRYINEDAIKYDQDFFSCY